jgi:hypothetical protein
MSHVRGVLLVFRRGADKHVLPSVPTGRSDIQKFIDCGSSDIDAEWVARFFATTFLFARGERTHNGLIAKEKVVAIEDVKIFVHERWHGRNEHAMFRIGT